MGKGLELPPVDPVGTFCVKQGKKQFLRDFQLKLDQGQKGKLRHGKLNNEL